MKNLGVRAHDLNKNDLEELINILESINMSKIQLALTKSFPNNFNFQTIDQDYLHVIANQLQLHQIDVPILGCYTNIIDSNIDQRDLNLNLFKKFLDLSRYFPGSVVATETGSLSDDGYTEKNFTDYAFQKVVSSVKTLVSYATHQNTIVAIEPGTNHPLYTNQLTKELLDIIANPQHLKIIFDPVNLLTPKNYLNQKDIITEAFSLYGDSITACHLKDFKIINHKLVVVPFGKGLLDKSYLFSLINKKSINLNYFLESTSLSDIKDIKDMFQLFM